MMPTFQRWPGQFYKSFIRALLQAYCVPGTVSGIGERQPNLVEGAADKQIITVQCGGWEAPGKKGMS